jgi:hypothetical protein
MPINEESAKHPMEGPNVGQAAVEPMLQFFEFDHLKEPLRAVSERFHALVYVLVHTLPRNPERTVAFRKLLEAKDCAVRALIYKM